MHVKLLSLLLLSLPSISSLSCYAGQHTNGKWTSLMSVVQCPKSHFWCVISRELDSDKQLDQWIFGCASEQLCKDTNPQEEEGIREKVQRRNNKGMSLFTVFSRVSNYDLCCRSDMCNLGPDSRANSKLVFSLAIFVSVNVQNECFQISISLL
ncbi:hypothetical protein M3Y98_00190200 [Aphelenchoides besseyi]|nr:hypothetical protein M3Y98_00190200 [Aphelenchoides besseyi]KAI6200204.1 hypothetical protein M3Y96_00708100 [Aphelenchoides besseyi]